MAPPLSLTGLGRSYGRLVALRSLDLEVAAGECVALVGANGSGKSTAVRTACGLIEPSEGRVRIDGHDPHTEPDAERARAAFALVPDEPQLYDELTVRRHLELVAVAHGAAGDGLDAHIDELLDRLGLAARADFRPGELSRGMRQKTMVACALVRPARLLVLDEPVVGLDPPSQRTLHAILRERLAAGAAVLLTTHQPAFADGLVDRALRLEEGEVADAGPWDELRTRADGWLGG